MKLIYLISRVFFELIIIWLQMAILATFSPFCLYLSGCSFSFLLCSKSWTGKKRIFLFFAGCVLLYHISCGVTLFQEALILAFKAKCDFPQLHFFRILIHSAAAGGNYQKELSRWFTWGQFVWKYSRNVDFSLWRQNATSLNCIFFGF